MKRHWIRLSQQYGAALRTHLKQGAQAGLPLARRVGRRAASNGLCALDLARMHDQALATLRLSSSKDGMLKHTNAFFAEAFAPVEETSRSAQKAATQLRQLSKTLRQRTAQLATAHRLQNEGVVQRKTLENALRKQTDDYAKLSEESRDFHQGLQQLNRQVFSAQEDERAAISRKLHNGIAQEFLGIQVRLVALKKENAGNTSGLKKDIASAQRLVEKSAKTLERLVGQVRLR